MFLSLLKDIYLIVPSRFTTFEIQLAIMNTLIIDKKKYVIVGQREYEKLLEKAAVKKPSARKLSLTEGKKLALKLIDKWHKEK